MPYMLIAYRNGGWPHTTAMRDEISKSVVATLDEAKEAVHAAAQSAYGRALVPGRDVLSIEALRGVGGKVGPFEDGTIVDVWPVTEMGAW